MMYKLVPILLRPKLLGTRNRWIEREKDTATRVRDAVLTGFGLALMIGIYYFFSWALTEADRFSDLAYLPPFIPLSIILLILFAMLLIASLVSSLGSLYLSRDLEFILSSPIRMRNFFFGKYLDVLLSSAWMPVIFVVPVILAFGHYYQSSLDFYGLSVLTLVPYFMIPPALAIILSGCFTTLVPARHTRQLLALALLMFIYFIYEVVNLISWGAANKDNVGEVLKMLSVLSLPHATWLPSHWAARILSESLEVGTQGIWLELSLLFFFITALLCTSFLIILNFHFHGYSKAASGATVSRKDVLMLRRVMSRFNRYFPTDLRAMVLKEYSFFFREITQSVQLILLVGIYIVYLYNLRVFQVISSLPPESRLLWENLIFVINVCMGSFVTTAICTRFVFPSLSLEGKSYWMLRTAPLTTERLLQIKFLIWFPPVGFLSSILLAVGMYVVDIGWTPIWINYLSGWIISCGLVGLAIGFGAIFSNFDWEHASQLAASFGSMVYMLAATMLISLNLLLVELVVFVSKMIVYQTGARMFFCGMLMLCAGVGVVLLNLFAKEAALQYGTAALDNKMK